jgi:hypothetical protein
MQPARQAPDWGAWLLLDEVKSFEAVALSLNIDLRNVKPQREG